MLLNLIRAIFTATVVATLLLGCGSDDNSDQDTESRSFLMGFTPFPYDADPATLLTVVDDVYAKLDNDADMVLHHLEEGIPWNAALAGVLVLRVSQSMKI